jgi:fatty-acyl-CoA synthase
MPKGTLWNQRDIWIAALGGDKHLRGTIDDLSAYVTARGRFHTALPNAPFMHGAAQWIALRTLLDGGTIVVNSVVDRLDPVDVWTLVENENVDQMAMIGESFARPLLDEFESGAYSARSLKAIIVSGAATSAETKMRLLRSFPTTKVIDNAGSSETGAALSAVASGSDAGEDRVFTPAAGVTVLDEALSRRESPGHSIPGWFAKSGCIPLGYLGDQDKTHRTFPTVEGVRWSIPGDRARLRRDGKIELLGRESATINTGGEKVFAEEVEAAIMTHRAILDAVVVGRPSERWGQEVVAVVSIREGSTVSDDELFSWLGDQLARYKLPKQIRRVQSVVRSPSGKVDYRWAVQAASATNREEITSP